MPQRRPDKEKNGTGKAAGCAKTAARLCAYLDGGMDAIERDGMNRHLTDCAACRAELEIQRQAETALAAARFALPPAGDLRADFYSRLQTENAARAKRPAYQWKLAAPALAAAGLAAILWRPGAEAPAKRNETAPLPALQNIAKMAPQNFAGRAPTRREKPSALSELKTAPGASRPSILRVAEASPVAKKTPETPASSSPPLHREQNLASVAAKTIFAGETPRQIALATESERAGSHYAMRLSSAAMPQGAMQRKEAFYYEALPADSMARSKEAPQDNFGLKSDASLADGTADLAAAPESADALKSSDAASLPTTLAALALTPGAPALVETPVAIQIAASAAFDTEKAEVSAPDGVDFEVRDDERGFVSRMKVTDSIERQQDGETLTIEAEADNGS